MSYVRALSSMMPYTCYRPKAEAQAEFADRLKVGRSGLSLFFVQMSAIRPEAVDR